MEKELKWYLAVVLMIFIFLLILFIMTPIKKLFFPLVLGGILAYFLRAPVNALSNKIGRTWAVAVVFILLIIIVGIIITFLVPVIIKQTADLANKLPQYVQSAFGLITDIAGRLGLQTDKPLNESLLNHINDFSRQLSTIADRILDNISNIAETMLLYAFSPVMAFFLLKDSKRVERSLSYMLPLRWRSAVTKTLKEVDGQLWRYVVSQLITATAVGVLTTIGLTIVGVGYAPVLGLITGVFEMIPYFGPILSIIPIAAVASTYGWSELVWSIVVVIAIQQMESLVLSPLIVGGNLKLHPAFIILTVLVGNLLFGIAGMVFAVPVVLFIRVIIQNIYRSLIDSRQVKV